MYYNILDVFFEWLCNSELRLKLIEGKGGRYIWFVIGNGEGVGVGYVGFILFFGVCDNFLSFIFIFWVYYLYDMIFLIFVFFIIYMNEWNLYNYGVKEGGGVMCRWVNKLVIY